ncbi:UBA3 [Fasciola gigantica]|uniref:NEDD8-activating enzyme E1 catalytic subunit n=1 Tax=Fasciola gigantica TaxID=46835 RepID=A0A504YYH7_FASGI|nr:UBA3 [Fasciola gigantica]
MAAVTSPNRWRGLNCLLERSGPFQRPDFQPSDELLQMLQDHVKILVVGAGGLGCELLKDLALMGFTNLDVIDMDTIDVSNLNRQFLFRPNDLGKSKAEVAAEFVMKRVPSCKASLVVYNEDGSPDPTTVVPLVDGGTEGFKGHVLVVLYGLTGCVECSLDLYPPQVNFPLCTIAHTPRLPEHCVEYVRILLWPKEQPFGANVTIDGDCPEHIQWIYEQSLKRAHEYGITGITLRLVQGVVKRIIPAVASTNAVIAAACATEAQDQFVKRYFHVFMLYPFLLCTSILFNATCYIYTLVLYVLYARNVAEQKPLITHMFHVGLQLLISNFSILIVSVIAQSLWNSDFYCALTALLKSITLGERDPSYDLVQVQQIIRATEFATTSCNWPTNAISLGSRETNHTEIRSTFDPTPVDCVFRQYKLSYTSVVANIAVNQCVVFMFLGVYTFYIRLKLITFNYTGTQRKDLFDTFNASKHLQTGWARHMAKAYRTCIRWLRKPVATSIQLTRSSLIRSICSALNQMRMTSGYILSTCAENVARLIPCRCAMRSSTNRASILSKNSDVNRSLPNLSQLTPRSASSDSQSVEERYYSLSQNSVNLKQLCYPPRLVYTQSLDSGRCPVRRRYLILDLLGLDYSRRFGPDCLACNNVPKLIEFAPTQTLRDVFNYLKESIDFQMKSPSMTTVQNGANKSLFIDLPEFAEVLRPNLSKTLLDLGLQEGQLLQVSDVTTPRTVSLKLHLTEPTTTSSMSVE